MIMKGTGGCRGATREAVLSGYCDEPKRPYEVPAPVCSAIHQARLGTLPGPLLIEE